MNIKLIKNQTEERLGRFNKLRGHPDDPEVFWDYVVLTAVDEAQKESYKLQLEIKLQQKELPLSAEYIVVADPPGPKIGNGGSTMVVLDHLFKTFEDDIWSKKVIIIHAGGFSQRLPNASVMGKAFLGMPFGEPMYQALELKLASYIDFPQKIPQGGFFVCCADTVEVYNDDNASWVFASDGFTALTHMSPMSIGTTHGVFVLDKPISRQHIVYDCRKFLHKPSFKLMESTKNCVIFKDEKDSWVTTDSAFFISPKVAKLLLHFYETNAPLSCEIDAYGDFLQALGKESSSDYIHNNKNVCEETDSLVQTRQKIYDLLHIVPLYAITLFPKPKNESSSLLGSIFYHFGTVKEYRDNFTVDKNFRSMLGVQAITSSKGVPHQFTITNEENFGSTKIKISDQGALSCSVQQVRCSTPCIMGSVLLADVSIGQGTIIEYSYIREGVKIGDNCIISNCSLPRNISIPNCVFMDTVAIKVDNPTLYVTIILEAHADTKKSVSKENALDQLFYFNKPLKSRFSEKCLPNSTKASLWNVKIFPATTSMVESCETACKALNGLTSADSSLLYKDINEDSMFSITNILSLKDLNSVLEFRKYLANEIHSV
uniref:fucose-1-phosphate guanylyltransferase-like n=1 Tax=Styela clava TaxID=7725 RepID=UPI00193A2BBA|nr:fucose-1-phosphate guanylyltransferase-like [Styela clava]